MYERKQNGEVFFSSLCVTYSRFGNYPANGLVTEQPQYSVVVCIFHILQNTEIQLISNDLRLIFTYSLLLASPCIFHYARHTMASICANRLGIDIARVDEMLNHSDPKMALARVYIEKDFRPLWDANRRLLDLFDWSFYTKEKPED